MKIDIYLLERIIRDLPNYIFVKDQDLIYKLCNQNFIEAVGGNPIGQNDYELPWDKNLARLYQEEDRYILSTGKSILNKEVPMNLLEEKKYLSVSKVPLYDKNENIVGILGIYIDLTEKKRAEKTIIQAKIAAEAANKAKTEFIANMSHDIRTPITGMLGLMKMMIYSAQAIQATELTASLGSTVQEFITTIEQNNQLLIDTTQELLKLCNEILETVQFDSGQIDEQSSVFCLSSLLQHNLTLLQAAAKNKGIDLRYSLEENLPDWFQGFRHYLDRTLLNLLSNALKFTQQGHVKVMVQLEGKKKKRYTPENPIRLEIIVEDTGIGIPEDKFETIFGYFSRLTPAYQGIHKGNGLGLYTVKRYVKAMQGSIRVESKMGQGSRFILSLPFTVAEAQEPDKERHPTRVPITRTTYTPQKINFSPKTADANAPTLLLVEDSPMATLGFQAELKPFPCRLDIATTGQEAVDKVTKNSYALIWMDVGLPDFTGIEATKKIRALADPKKSTVPIVALTGHANNPAMRQEALDAGMQDVLSKPIITGALESLLQRYVFSVSKQQATVPIAESSTSVSDAILDWKGCVRQHRGNAELVRELLAMLDDDLVAAQVKLAKTYQAGDYTTLREELHRVRGGVAYLQVPRLEQTLRTFHDATNDPASTSTTLDALYTALQQAIVEFQEHWKNGVFE